MIVQCDQCQTKFNLDEAKVPEDGAWVRCSNCGNVFQVMADGATPPPPAAEPPQAFSGGEELGEPLDDMGMDLSEPGEVDLDASFDLGGGGREKKPGGGAFKVVFWLISLLILLVLVLLGTLVALNRLGVGQDFVRAFQGLPLVSSLLDGAPEEAGEDEALRMTLKNVRGYFRNNNHAGRIFVIQGSVDNEYPAVRSGVLVRGRLTDPKGQVVREAVVYAGNIFTPDELVSMSLQDFQARLAKPTGPDGSRYVVTPGGSIPFMIVFGDLPSNLSEFTAEVVGSEPLAGESGGK